MAKFSQKQGGKEVGQAAVYAEPHTMEGARSSASEAKGKTASQDLNEMDISMGTICRKYEKVKTDGIKIRGTGAATKGVKARGPMA